MKKSPLPTDKHAWHPSPLPGQIVLITTIDGGGQPSVAPKSWISMVAFGPPPILMFGCNWRHATARNARDQGEFVVNVPGVELAEMCWALGSGPHVAGPERFERQGLTLVSSETVRPPRIRECRAHLECRLDGLREWGQEVAVFGRVEAVSMDAEVLDFEMVAGYEALSPFFFLEDGVMAALGRARPAAEPEASHPQHILTILAVSNLDASAHFYRRAFGWPTRIEVPVFVELELPDGRGLGLYQRRAFGHNTGELPARLPEGAIAGTEIYLHCDQLEAVIARLEEAGARTLSPLSPRDWGDEAAYFADPDGNVLVVARPML